jgi:hypothetical protein
MSDLFLHKNYQHIFAYIQKFSREARKFVEFLLPKPHCHATMWPFGGGSPPLDPPLYLDQTFDFIFIL